MYGYIYITTDRLTGKIYIGQKHGKFTPSYKGSGKDLRPLLKERPEDFTVRLLAKRSCKKSLNLTEKFYIKLFDARNPEKGYNISKGGTGWNSQGRKKGFKHSALTIEKIRKGVTGFNHTEEAKQKMQKHIKSVEHRKKISESHKRRPKSTYPCKPIQCIETEEIFESVTATGYCNAGLVANGKRKYAGGFTWRWV